MNIGNLSSGRWVAGCVVVLGLVASAVVVAAPWRNASRPGSVPVPVRGNPGSITVSGNAQVLVVPDQVELRLGIVCHDAELGRAKQENDRRTAATLARLKAMGLPARDYQTDAIHVQPEYETTGGRPPELKRYLVQRHVVITLREVGRFEELLQSALDAGVNQVLDVQFCSTELRRHRDQARQMAVRAAREKAELLVGELGGRLGRAMQITEQSPHSGWSSYSFYGTYGGWGHSRSGGYMMQNSIAAAPGPEAAGGEGRTDTFAPGQIQVSAMVTVHFEVE